MSSRVPKLSIRRARCRCQCFTEHVIQTECRHLHIVFGAQHLALGDKQAHLRIADVECFAQAAQCVSSWARDGGTTEALVAARKQLGDEMTPDSSLTRVRLVRKVEVSQGGVTSREDLPGLDDQMQSTASTFQRWINAGIEYKPANEGRYVVWPVVSGIDMSRVPAASTVRVLPVEVTVPMPLAVDLIRGTPRNIWWSDLRVWVDDTAGDTAAVKVFLKGKSYVR